ncbi:hypothetical protein FRB95_013558 [Tulasnella sp. JGI-2019a]|nr:hypothetical protein FRB95_013558 [Tulasnella sp. JGI-2019a]
MSTHNAICGLYSASPVKAIKYGPGSVSYLIELIKLVSENPDAPQKALTITGESLATKTPFVKQVEDLLKMEGMYGDTFFGIGQHAPIQGIRDAVQIVKDKKITVLIGLETGGTFVPQVAIPTTLSAAEFTMSAGFTSEQGHKTGVANPAVIPKAVILDAEPSLHIPDRLWLSTGMRAVDHAIETHRHSCFNAYQQ